MNLKHLDITSDSVTINCPLGKDCHTITSNDYLVPIESQDEEKAKSIGLHSIEIKYLNHDTSDPKQLDLAFPLLEQSIKEKRNNIINQTTNNSCTPLPTISEEKDDSGPPDSIFNRELPPLPPPPRQQDEIGASGLLPLPPPPLLQDEIGAFGRDDHLGAVGGLPDSIFNRDLPALPAPPLPEKKKESISAVDPHEHLGAISGLPPNLPEKTGISNAPKTDPTEVVLPNPAPPTRGGVKQKSAEYSYFIASALRSSFRRMINKQKKEHKTEQNELTTFRPSDNNTDINNSNMNNNNNNNSNIINDHDNNDYQSQGARPKTDRQKAQQTNGQTNQQKGQKGRVSLYEVPEDLSDEWWDDTTTDEETDL